MTWRQKYSTATSLPIGALSGVEVEVLHIEYSPTSIPKNMSAEYLPICTPNKHDPNIELYIMEVMEAHTIY